MDKLTLNYGAYDDALKLALAGQEPGTEVVLTIRAQVVANTDESADLSIEEVTLDKAEPVEAEEETDDMPEEDAPAIVVAVAKKKS